MRKLTLIGFIACVSFLFVPISALAQFTTQQGGTGTTSSVSGILYGDQTLHLKTVGIGAGCSFVGGTLTCTGTGSSYPFPLTGNATGTLTQFNGGLTAYASSTIGNGNQNGGLTISGNATTTSNLSVAGATLGTNALAVTGTASVSGNISSTGGNVTASGNVQAGSGNGFVWSNGNGIKSSVSGQFIFNNNGSSVLTTLSIPASGTLQVGAAGDGTLVSGYHGIGTSTPYALLSVLATSTNGSGAPTTLFAIASTTGGTSTSTLFSISNTGSTTLFQIASSILKTNSSGVIIKANSGSDYVNGSGVSGNCVNWGANNTLGDAGAACGSGGGGTFPFTPFADGNSTSTLILFAKGASTTLLSVFDGEYFGRTSTTTIFGNGATSTFKGSIAISTTSPTALSIQDQYGTSVFNTNTASTTGDILDVASSTGTVYLSVTPGGLVGMLNASTSLLSVFTKSYFGGTVTTTIDSAGNIVIPSASNLTITGKSDGCATFATGVLNSTGVACGSGGGSFAWPWTLSNVFGTANANATGTLEQLTAGLAASTTVRFGNAGLTNQFVWDSTVGLGLGTSTPRWPLQVASSTAAQITLSDATAGDNHWSLRGIGNSFYIATSSPTTFATSTTAALSINSSGQPIFPSLSAASGSNCLQINTAGLITNTGAACASSGGGTYPFTPSSDGGINTSATSTPVQGTNPGLGLDVSNTSWYGIGGALLAYGSTTNQSTTFGLGAGGNSATTSALVGAITTLGYQAGAGLTFGNITNATNAATGTVAIGTQSLLLATSSPGNTALGWLALRGSGTVAGIWSATGLNTAVGYWALASTTSGNTNTAVGYKAMPVVTTGSSNLAIGSTALLLATAASVDTAIGIGALSAVTTQTNGNNVAVGFNAGGNVTSGQSGVYIGVSTKGATTGANNVYVGSAVGGNGGTTASNNTIVGQGAFTGITTGSNNSLFGFQTGINISTGYDNIIIGEEQNTGGNNITTGGGDIFVGYNAMSTSTGSTLSLNIGNFLFGTLPATSSLTSLQIPTSGLFGVGTTSPFARLSVALNNLDSTLNAFAIGSSTATATTTLFSVTNTGHTVASSTSPILSACGTTPTMKGDDTHGEVTLGTTATGCTITFANAWTIAPVCTVTWQGTPLLSQSYVVSSTAITLTQTSTSNDKIDYICEGLTGQ